MGPSPCNYRIPRSLCLTLDMDALATSGILVANGRGSVAVSTPSGPPRTRFVAISTGFLGAADGVLVVGWPAAQPIDIVRVRAGGAPDLWTFVCGGWDTPCGRKARRLMWPIAGLELPTAPCPWACRHCHRVYYDRPKSPRPVGRPLGLALEALLRSFR
jgi:hypothetical protein